MARRSFRRGPATLRSVFLPALLVPASCLRSSRGTEERIQDEAVFRYDLRAEEETITRSREFGWENLTGAVRISVVCSQAESMGGSASVRIEDPGGVIYEGTFGGTRSKGDWAQRSGRPGPWKITIRFTDFRALFFRLEIVPAP